MNDEPIKGGSGSGLSGNGLSGGHRAGTDGPPTDPAVELDPFVEVRRAIEAMLLVASEPTEEHLLAQVLELPSEAVRHVCLELAADYEASNRGFQLVEVAGGWRIQTHPAAYPYVERYAMEGLPNRLSTAALETLAIVAYKQPISRIQISAIRGVNADGVLKTLEQRGYVEEVGRDSGPGQATLFGTTGFFLERLELASIDDLPPLGDFVPSADVLEALEQSLRIEGEPDQSSEPKADQVGPPVDGDTLGEEPESLVDGDTLGEEPESLVDGDTLDEEPESEVANDSDDA